MLIFWPITSGDYIVREVGKQRLVFNRRIEPGFCEASQSGVIDSQKFAESESSFRCQNALCIEEKNFEL